MSLVIGVHRGILLLLLRLRDLVVKVGLSIYSECRDIGLIRFMEFGDPLFVG